jgi:hypothetical protein
MAEPKYLSSVPKKIPAGRAVCHNFVPGDLKRPLGERGFRAFTYPADDLPDNFAECPCGWSGLKHYVPASRLPLPAEALTETA